MPKQLITQIPLTDIDIEFFKTTSNTYTIHLFHRIKKERIKLKHKISKQEIFKLLINLSKLQIFNATFLPKNFDKLIKELINKL